MNKKYNYLTKNIGLLSISQFGTKMLSFFLVPLYTNVLTTSEYGSFDLVITTVSLLIPLFTLNIGEGLIVFALEKKNNQRDVISIALKYGCIGTGLLFVLSFLNMLTGLIEPIAELWYFLPAIFFLSVLNTDLIYFVRGLDRIKDTAISGLICSAVIILLNIVFLVYFKWGIIGYFIAYIIGYASQIVFLFIKNRVWKYIIRSENKQLEKEMLQYSRPLIFNSLSWWINSCSDRYIIIALVGVAANGVYSVGYKIPSILDIVQTVFASAWSVSAIKDFDREDKDGFFSNMYGIYNCSLVMLCSVIIAVSRGLAHLLYAKDFYDAWQYSPFLTIAIVFGALSGYLGGVFAAVKETKIFAISTIVGSIINIVLNIIFVYIIGPMGAALATVISYCVIWLIRLIQVVKYINIRINIIRDICSYLMLVVQTLVLLFMPDTFYLYFVELILIIFQVLLFRKEMKKALFRIVDTIRGEK